MRYFIVSISLLFTALISHAQQTQTYYVPFPDDDVRTLLETGVPMPAQIAPPAVTAYEDQVSVISIVPLTSGSTITYDHWEDGFEADINNPTQSTTEIWGDGDISNGCAWGSPCGTNADDMLTAGQVVTNLSLIAMPRNQSVIEYDGKDKVVTSDPISMTRLAWNQGIGTVYAGAVEVYDTSSWGTNYLVPVGEDIMASNVFEYVGVSITAAENGTMVTVGSNPPVTLNEGETLLVDGGLMTGDSITSTEPIQVSLVATDRDAWYETRWYRIPPVDQFSSGYYNPVSTDILDDRTDVHLFNPGTAPITVSYERLVGGVPTTTTVTVPAGGSTQVPVTDLGTAQHYFTTDGSPFYALTVVDAIDSNLAHDWGLSLIPEDSLTPGFLVGYGPGQNPLLPFSTNVSPIWVTPVADTTLYVDYNGDGGSSTADCGSYDASFPITELQTIRLLDPDGDQSGMRVFTCDGVAIAAAWGQDPEFAPTASPSIDVGTTVPPIPFATARKQVALLPANDLNGDGVLNPGEVLTYTVLVINNSFQDAQGVTIDDTPDSALTYQANSSTIDGAPLADAGATPFPLDEGGLVISNVPARTTITITYDLQLDSAFDFSRPVENCATVGNAIGSSVVCTETIAVPAAVPKVPSIKLTKTVTADGTCPGLDFLELPAGTPVLYCVLVENDGETPLINVTVTDNDISPAISTNIGSLAIGETRLLQFPSTVTAPLVNTASVIGTNPEAEAETVQDSDPAEVAVKPVPSIRLVKTVSNDGSCPGVDFLQLPPGTPIIYCVFVENDGETPLVNVRVTDNDITPPVNELVGSLAIGETRMLQFPATLTDSLVNTASVVGTNPDDPTETVRDSDIAEVAPTLVLGDIVWKDTNDNGLRDPGERGLPFLEVQLYQAGDTPGVSAPVATTFTDNNGIYMFEDLLDGDYFVYLPETFPGLPVSSSPDVTDTADNQQDDDDNGIQAGSGDPTQSPDISLSAGTEPTNDGDNNDGDLTIDFGFYAPVTIGDYVWNDLNVNGIQDPNEPGVANVTIEVYEVGSSTPTATTTSNSDGQYLFTELPPGNYFIRLVTSSLPPGFIPTLANAGSSDILDSDIDEITGDSAPTGFLNSGEQDLSVDVGIWEPGKIGDTVWQDIGNDGKPENDNLSMLGLTGVEVLLFQVENGVFNPEPFDRTVTVDNGINAGFYQFTELPPGDYRVRVNFESITNMFPIFTTPVSYPLTIKPGTCVTNADFGFAAPPAAVGLESFDAELTDSGVSLVWQTAWEDEALGFNLYRRDGEELIRVNDALVLANGSASRYELHLDGAGAGEYVLEEIDNALFAEEVGSAETMRPAAPAAGDETVIIQAEDDAASFRSGSEYANYLVTGLSGEPVVTDETDADNPVRLRPEILQTSDGFGAYFSVAPGSDIVVRAAE